MDKTSKYFLATMLLFFCSGQYVHAVSLHSQEMPEDPMDGVEDNDDGKMQVITLMPSKVEFAFFKSAQDGIYVLSEVKDDGSEFLLITNKEGEQLYMMDHSGNDLLYSVSGSDFFLSLRSQGEEQVLAGFTIPSDYHKEMKNAFKEHRVTRTELDHLEFEGANVTRNIAFEKFLQRAEVSMIVEAAVKLGNDMQIPGTEYPAAMTFYMLAMRLNKYQNNHFGNTDNYGASGDAQDEHHLTKRSHCGWFKRYCSNNDRCCSKCPRGRNCVGLCGDGCNCWRWVCGNCCYNRGCYDHDQCCFTNQYSWGCLVPVQWGVSPFVFCTVGYWCYSDATIPYAEDIHNYVRNLFRS